MSELTKLNTISECEVIKKEKMNIQDSWKKPDTITVGGVSIDVSDYSATYEYLGGKNIGTIYYKTEKDNEYIKIDDELKCAYFYLSNIGIHKNLSVFAMEIKNESGKGCVMLGDGKMHTLSSLFGEDCTAVRVYVQKLSNGKNLISLDGDKGDAKYVVCDEDGNVTNNGVIKSEYCVSNNDGEVFGVDKSGKYTFNNDEYDVYIKEGSAFGIKIDPANDDIAVLDISDQTVSHIDRPGGYTSTAMTEINTTSASGKYLIGKSNNSWYYHLVSLDSKTISDIAVPEGYDFLGNNPIAVDDAGALVYMCKDKDNHIYIGGNNSEKSPIKIPLGMKDPILKSFENGKVIISYKKPNEENKRMTAAIDMNDIGVEVPSEVELKSNEIKELLAKLAEAEKEKKRFEDWKNGKERVILDKERELAEKSLVIVANNEKIIALENANGVKELELKEISNRITAHASLRTRKGGTFSSDTYRHLTTTDIENIKKGKEPKSV